MSEYQYYAFRALDRALTQAQLEELRALSTRARITPTSFVNEYHWGDFKGRPKELMERYFDFHFYFANWGTRIVMLRLPELLFDPELARTYCQSDAVAVWTKGDHVFLEITSEEEPEYDEEVDEDYFQPLLELRGELMRGDHRLLYLLWLLGAQTEEVDVDEPEPLVPPGLGELTIAQGVFCDVMRIDRDLVAAAAERSAPVAPAASPKEVGAWLRDLPTQERDAWLERVVAGEGVAVQAEILAHYRDAREPAAVPMGTPRTVANLWDAAEARAKRRQQEEARR